MPRTKMHMSRLPLTTVKLNTCDVCGRELSSEESISRHRGELCHSAWQVKRISDLELQVELTRAAVAILMKK